MPEIDGKEVPEGVMPIFLTASTQEGYGVQDCSSIDPIRWIPKQTFIDEIKFKGAISDMYVLKKEIEKYKGDELLLHYDDDEIYGQNFFICLKPEATVQFVEAQAAREEELKKSKKKGGGGGGGDAGGDAGGEDEDDYEEEEYVPPVSKPWAETSTTIAASEAEIVDEAVVETRERIVMSMVRKRKEFNVPYKFSDRDAQEDPNITQNDCRPYKDPNFETKRKELHIGVQAVPGKDEQKTQTTWFRPVNKALQYESIGLDDRAKFDQLNSAEMRTFLRTVRERYEEALQQNETVDIYLDDFADLAEDESSLGNKTDSELKELQSYYHLQYCAGRELTHIQWQPQAKGVVAVAGARRMTFEERVNVSGKVHTGYILLWNFSDPIHPQVVLEAPGDVHCFRFCPTNPDLVIGGLESGQIAMWSLADARAAAREAKLLNDDSNEEGGSSTITAQATLLSAADQSHKRTITDLMWLPASFEVTENKGKFVRHAEAPPTQNQFASIGADGTLLFWDVRKAQEQPEEKKEDPTPGAKKQKEGWGPLAKMALNNPDSAMELAPVFGVLDVSDDAEGPCSVYTVTEEGEFATVDLSAPGVENFTKGVKAAIPGHYGACVALQRSPFVPKVHLSVGDWTFNVWREGTSKPLFSSPFCPTTYTCGAWSPTRPAVLFIGRADGMIDIWDLLDRSHEPSMTVAVTPALVTTLEFTLSGARQLLAVGDDQGTVHVMEVPRNLRRAANNEKAFAGNFFAREEKRVEYVQQRSEALAEGGGGGAEAGGAPVEVKEGEPTEDEKLEAVFREVEAKFLEDMEIVLEQEAAPADVS